MIMLIHGKDRYRALVKFDSIKSLALTKQAKYFEYDFEDEVSRGQNPLRKLQEILQSIKTSSFFQEKRFIVLRNLSIVSKTYPKQLGKELSSLNTPSEVILLVFEDQKLPKSHQVVKTLTNQGAKIEEFNPLTGIKLQAFVQKEFATYHSSADQSAVKTLIGLLGEDPFKLHYGVNKVVNYHSNPAIITQQMVQEVVADQEAQAIFGISDQLFHKQYAQMISFLQQFEQRGEEGIMILGYLVSQIRKALLIQDAKDRREDYKVFLGGNAYALDLLARQSQSWTRAELLGVYKGLSELDYKVKFEGMPAYTGLYRWVQSYLVKVASDSSLSL